MATAPHVKINTRTFPVTFTVGAAPTAAFSFEGVFWDDGDIIVRKDGVVQDPVLYSVSGRYEQDGLTIVGAFGGGTVTFNSPVQSCTITVDRLVQATRDTDYSPTAPLPVNTLNSDLDRATARDQDLLALISGGGGLVSGVSSVNGKIGTVFLTAVDVGAALESHAHAISQVTGLQAALDAKMALAGGTFTGVVSGIAPAAADSSTKIPTTAWVQTEIASLGGGVTLVTTGTPADLGVASRGTALTAARSDHVHKIPTLSDLAAAAVDLTNVSTANLRSKIVAASGLVLDATDAGKTAAPIVANFVLAADASKNLVWVDPGGVGGGGVTSVNGATGVVTVTAADLGAVRQSSFRTADHYGVLNGNNVADNKATLDLMLAGSDGQVWIPGTAAETLFTTNGIFDFANKRMRGATKFRTSAGDWMPADFRYMNAAPAAGSGVDIYYNLSADNWFSDVGWYWLGANGDPGRIRVDPSDDSAVPRYFESRFTPSYSRFTVNSGGSGCTAVVRSPGASIGATSIPIDLSGTVGSGTGFTAGHTVGFSATPGSAVLFTRELASPPVTGSGASATLNLTSGIPSALSLGAAVFNGRRTMAARHFIEVDHRAEGDAGGIVIRMYAGRTPTLGQRHPFLNQTAGAMHYDVMLTAPGTYGNCSEGVVNDNGNDGWGIGHITNLQRTVNTEPNKNCWYGHLVASATGALPINAHLTVTGPSDCALNTVIGDYGANKAAIALKAADRIYFDHSVDATLNPDVYPLHGNVVGNSHMSVRANGEIDSRGKRLEFVVNGNLSLAGYGAMNIRGSVLEFHRPLVGYTNSGTRALYFDPPNAAIYLGADSDIGVRRIGNDFHVIAAGGGKFSVQESGYVSAVGALNSDIDLRVAGTKVVGARGAAIANPTADVGSLQTAVIAILDRLRPTAGHGLISA